MKKMQVILKTGRSEFRKIFNEDIIYFKAERNYCMLINKEGKNILLSYPLSTIEQLTELESFERVHRSYFINSEHITGLNMGKKPAVTMVNGVKIPISSNKIEDVLKLFGN